MLSMFQKNRTLSEEDKKAIHREAQRNFYQDLCAMQQVARDLGLEHTARDMGGAVSTCGIETGVIS